MVPAPSTSAAGNPAFSSSSSTSSSTTTATTPVIVNGNVYQDALDGLQPLQPVLRGFNHRNRNQHRRAAWWAPFGMLRRHVEKLVDGLLEASAAAVAASKSKSKKRRRDGGDGNGNGGGSGVERNVRRHVEWLRDVLVPKCYLAFSQLTADNQFATLGVVLLGVLAQVNATCVRLVGEAAATAELSAGETGTPGTLHEPSGSTTVLTGANKPRVQVAKGQSSRPLVVAETPGDRGGSKISRDEVARAEKLRRKNNNNIEAGSSSDIASTTTATTTVRPKQVRDDSDGGSDDEKPLQKKKQQQEATSSKPKKGKEKEEVGAKPAKKKKTKKGGDEFDDLFKNLF
ncbi:hypothetical protein F4811DRAFT_503736 [Daldinia bambusicola]|nr:hypothetical protein F4811DRAFT_503736 [Daldinia bambusicola]